MKSTFTIAGRKVGISEPAYLIAEAGVNHDCLLERGQALVDTARAAGFDVASLGRSLLKCYEQALERKESHG